MEQNLTNAIIESIRKNRGLPALSDFRGRTLTYGELATAIARMHLFLKGTGVKPGDKVALCARNSARWAALFLGAFTYGATVVPPA